MSRLYGSLERLLWCAGVAMLASTSLVIVGAAYADSDEYTQCKIYCQKQYGGVGMQYMTCVSYCDNQYAATCSLECSDCGGMSTPLNHNGEKCGPSLTTPTAAKASCTNWCTCSCQGQTGGTYNCSCGKGTYSNPP